MAGIAWLCRLSSAYAVRRVEGDTERNEVAVKIVPYSSSLGDAKAGCTL